MAPPDDIGPDDIGPDDIGPGDIGPDEGQRPRRLSNRVPGWYADPGQPGHWRWWDGASWTGHSVSADPGTTAGPDGARPRGPGGRRAQPRRARTAVLAKRWAAVLVAVAVVVAVLAVVLRGHPPALYWSGEPIGNADQVLSGAESTMKATAAAQEAVLSPHSRCYFSLPNRSSHDVQADLWCGPVLFPWSSAGSPWLEYRLTARVTGKGANLRAAAKLAGSTTVVLPKGDVLRRPDGASPPKGDGGLSVPLVPYQPAGWGGLLKAPPSGLTPAPVDDVLGGWAHDYRLVAYGEVGHMPANLDRDALRSAVNPKGSGWSTSVGSRSPNGHLAKVLVPASGQVFVVAQLAQSPGEAAGPVPAAAASLGGATGSSPLPGPGSLAPGFEVTTPAPGAGGDGTTGAAVVIGGPKANATSVYVVASVPIGSRPALVVSERGLQQDVSLVNGQPDGVPSVLARLSPNEHLDASGRLPGVTVHLSDASLAWFAGSDGGIVPPSPNDAYLEVMMTASPFGASLLAPSDFALRLAGGQVVNAVALPDSDRDVILMGFVVPASFSTGTVVVSAGGGSFTVPVDFP